ncbi:phosphate transporter [Bacillus wiedmannii]|uniref:phosphate transporter n=1 Tax=Bacillus wiedmannii TaxID=1890302 RepID=UPI000BF0CC46|nr:phosphate transporter [Bacillus wiedmannii]PEL14610.1 phosphate transporter [Bacillus wiedmannii]PHD16821.1 phosphate transporter [Bacillus wiedmannii]
MMDRYVKKEKHSLIISTNDAYNKEEGVYETIDNVINQVLNILNLKYNLYIYYLGGYSNKSKENEKYVALKGIFTRDVVIFEPLELSILNDGYISERFIVGDIEIEQKLESIMKNSYRSIVEIEEYLFENCEVVCKIFDSAYIEIQTKDHSIIEEIKNEF